ncbi:dienelactone hydrolase family protein [Compostimonas suwonensis]|uniref:Carboxymethylenebutenolidase n=1 Tax=Compostimonas suwonensis TaxID=1048394 RepID=A0A2M9C4B6_9MICO|nr:dienelactone hydrolase family protein [Compostimonas suwonensis]PJJ65363.1 carboxymethylenebutenolidase [Compostimonas suwonensis]
MGEVIQIPSPGVPIEFGIPGHPLVVVVHDWYGRLQGVLRYAELLAESGFHVVVPDLYDGVATLDDDTAEELLDRLDLGFTLATLDDVIRVGRESGSPRTGLVGFSAGGWLALLAAQAGSVDAVVAYYASLSSDEHGIIPAPVLLHFAEEDSWAPDQEPAAFIERLREHETPVTEHIYPNTTHSFANSSIEGAYSVQSAGFAFARTVTFLKDHLIDDIDLLDLELDVD